MRRTHLLVLGERVALGWVLREQRMAFPAGRAREVAALSNGDELLLYTTRGCWHNPTRHRGRVIASAITRSSVEPLAEPVELAGREFTLGCDIQLRSLAALGEGVELAPLVRELETFPSKTGWAMRLRRPLVTLTPQDARMLKNLLRATAGDPAEALADYLAAARPIR
jgi:hypothetical protein